MLRLRELRGVKSQIQIAAELNISQRTYSSYETGTRQPDHEMLLKMANYFGVSVDYLLGRTEPTHSQPSYPELEKGLEGIYFHFAKDAQELGLSKKDMDYIIDLYRRAKGINNDEE